MECECERESIATKTERMKHEKIKPQKFWETNDCIPLEYFLKREGSSKESRIPIIRECMTIGELNEIFYAAFNFLILFSSFSETFLLFRCDLIENSLQL